MISLRSVRDLVAELVHAALVALCPCGEHVPATTSDERWPA